MNFLKIPKGQGYWAGIFLIFGVIGLIAATGFWIFNQIFSAFGLMQLTGGVINYDFSNIYIPSFHIISGGKIGLIMALMGGILATISEGRLWVVPTKNKGTKSVIEKKRLFISFSLIFILYDILSSYYFLNTGTWFDNSLGFWPGVISSGMRLGITIILFSVGPEMFMVWAFETIAENHKDGIPVIGNGIGIILGGIKKIGSLISGHIFGDVEDDNEETSNSSRAEIAERFNSPSPARRGRPRLEESGEGSD